jgi:hypothetical protein
MKTYLFKFQTNWGLGVTIIKAYTKEEAIEIAKSDNCTWPPFNPICIEDLPQKLGICLQLNS